MGKEPKPLQISAEEIEAAKTPNGGWTRVTLEAWGVPWPPPKGWKDALLGGEAIVERESAPDSIEAKLLHDVVLAVINAGHGPLLNEVEGINAFYNSELPKVSDFMPPGSNYEITGELRLDDRVYRFWCARETRKN